MLKKKKSKKQLIKSTRVFLAALYAIAESGGGAVVIKGAGRFIEKGPFDLFAVLEATGDILISTKPIEIRKGNDGQGIG
jgi:hypothetical protein